MNRNILKNYAPQARRDFIQAVTDRASYYGLTKKKTEPVTVEGDVAVITGRAFPKKVAEQRKQLEQRVARQGFDQVMEAMAYTWFNRLVAIRFMELNGYLEHGYCVLSHPAGSNTPEILEHADSVDLPGLDSQQVIELKLAGDKDAELYRMLLIAQCNALHKAMPFLFEKIDDETELLLPDNLLHSDSLIRTLVNEIAEDDWKEVEIIGWLYQFYISKKKDQVIGKVVKSEDIPAATQLFTPNWIVKYLVQNSLGRQWMATYPHSSLKSQMDYYIEPAEQTPEVQEQLKTITPDKLNPEEFTLIDPACGSGHILVEAYDLLKAIYLERGFSKKDIPRLILEKNLFGLEIDDRAAQLASLALMMKARADDYRIFAQAVQPHVLSIQESKGLDAKEITEALNAPIMMTELPPSRELFEEIAEEKSPLFSKKNLSVKGDIAQADIARLLDLFEHGKTFGSLIQVPDNLAQKLPAIAKRFEDVIAHGGMFEQVTAKAVKPLLQQARMLGGIYDTVVTNPPYIGTRYMNGELKQFAKRHFQGFEKDLFSCFIVRCRSLGHAASQLGFMSPFVWMFISSHETLRRTIVDTATLTTLIQLEYSGFAEATVPICTFTFSNHHVSQYVSSFVRLSSFKGADNQGPRTLESIRNRNCGWFYNAAPDDFAKVPGTPIAYWVTPKMRSVFDEATALGEVAFPCQGMATTNNDLFLRHWYEVQHSKIGFDIRSEEESANSGMKWFPYNKGGDYRRWFGNNRFVVNYQNKGKEICEYIDNTPGAKVGSNGRVINRDRYFRPSVTWSFVSSAYFGVRVSDPGFVFDVGGSSAFPSETNRYLVAGFLCSNVAFEFMKAMNPTLNFQAGNVASLPFLPNTLQSVRSEIEECVGELVTISRIDWNMAETAWDFDSSPLIESQGGVATISKAFADLMSVCSRRIERAIELEIRNNRLVIEAYGLRGELPPDVAEDQITLYRPNREEDIQRLLSYGIGCMMGRYSLDEPGLIYAHSGNEGFDPTHYKTFPADVDGIVPITEFEWFQDDAAKRVKQFIATVWPEENLEENLKFVAESIGQKTNESARDAIRRYLSTGFYKHHLSLYKRRPIYWLFSSGKQRAFQCLVYLHRYNSGTLARMRTEYVIPLAGKIDARIEQLAGDITAASSTSHAKKMTKERDTLIKHSEELQKFDEKLKHYADQRIQLDLDDGVKVNYGKFGNLLAEVNAVTGQKAE